MKLIKILTIPVLTLLGGCETNERSQQLEPEEQWRAYLVPNKSYYSNAEIRNNSEDLRLRFVIRNRSNRKLEVPRPTEEGEPPSYSLETESFNGENGLPCGHENLGFITEASHEAYLARLAGKKKETNDTPGSGYYFLNPMEFVVYTIPYKLGAFSPEDMDSMIVTLRCVVDYTFNASTMLKVTEEPIGIVKNGAAPHRD